MNLVERARATIAAATVAPPAAAKAAPQPRPAVVPPVPPPVVEMSFSLGSAPNETASAGDDAIELAIGDLPITGNDERR
jgi:hypothetical protein